MATLESQRKHIVSLQNCLAELRAKNLALGHAHREISSVMCWQETEIAELRAENEVLRDGLLMEHRP